MRTKTASFLDALGASYWFLPALMTLAAVALSFLAVRVDQQGDLAWLRDLGFVFLNQPDGARSLLSTVAGALIGVAGTTFSITLAVLTLTSSQFGPRLLNTFMRDRGNQVVLGTFVATSLYCLLVLRTVRDASETAGPAFVPHLAVTVAVLLTVSSLAVFIYFIHHTANSIQVATILARIADDIEDLVDKRYPEPAAPDTAPEPSLPHPQAPRHVLRADHGGYLQTVDEQGLVAAAEKYRLLVRSLHLPGAFVIRGQPVAYLWSDAALAEDATGRLAANFTFGPRRTPVQDLGFLFDQLTEVALRALSPGINDPMTALRCADRIGQGLARLAAREPRPTLRHDGAGHLRLIVPELELETLVANTLGAIRRFSGDHLLVGLHLLGTVRVVLENTDHAALRRALLREAELVCEVAKPVLIEADYRRLDARYREVVSFQQMP